MPTQYGLCVYRTFCNLENRESNVEAELNKAELSQVLADLWTWQVAPGISYSKSDVHRNLLILLKSGHAKGDV